MRFLFIFSFVTFFSFSANALPVIHSFPEEQAQTLKQMKERVDAVLNFYNNNVVYPRAAAGILGQALKSSPNKKTIKRIVDDFTKIQALLKNIKRGHTMSLKGKSAKKHVEVVDFFVPIVNKMIKSQFNSCKGLNDDPSQYDAYVSGGKARCLNYQDMESEDATLDEAKKAVKKYAKKENLSMPSIN